MDMNKDLYLVQEIGNNIYLIDDNKNATAYLLVGENKSLLIDTGTGFGDLKSLVTDLTDLPIVVVNTHGHSDHVWGNYQFEEAYISKEDMDLYEDSYSQEERENIIKVFRDMIPSETTHEELNEWIKLKPCKTSMLKQGDVIDLGGKVLQVVEIPGHTKGSIVLIDEKAEILFSGDSLIGRLWMHLVESSDLKTYLRSIQELKNYSSKLKRIYSGHTKYEEEPYEISFIDDVIRDVTDIVEGRKTGTYLKDDSGECLICEFKNWSIWYNPNKI